MTIKAPPSTHVTRLSGACPGLGTGEVTIKDSTFYDNDSTAYRLCVESRGAITLTNVAANENNNTPDTDGARLYAQFSQLASPVTVTNRTFSGNGDQGLHGLYQRRHHSDQSQSHLQLEWTTARSSTIPSILRRQQSRSLVPSFRITSLTTMPRRHPYFSNGAVTVKYADSNGNGGSGVDIDNMTGTGCCFRLQGHIMVCSCG